MKGEILVEKNAVLPRDLESLQVYPRKAASRIKEVLKALAEGETAYVYGYGEKTNAPLRTHHLYALRKEFNKRYTDSEDELLRVSMEFFALPAGIGPVREVEVLPKGGEPPLLSELARALGLPNLPSKEPFSVRYLPLMDAVVLTSKGVRELAYHLALREGGVLVWDKESAPVPAEEAKNRIMLELLSLL